MKTSTILILIGSVALVGTASYFAYKKYSEKKSGIDGGCGCGCGGSCGKKDSENHSNIAARACAPPSVWNGWTCVDKVIKSPKVSDRAIKSATNPYKPKEKTSNACGCGM